MAVRRNHHPYHPSAIAQYQGALMTTKQPDWDEPSGPDYFDLERTYNCFRMHPSQVAC
jgi:hypothetical protein